MLFASMWWNYPRRYKWNAYKCSLQSCCSSFSYLPFKTKRPNHTHKCVWTQTKPTKTNPIPQKNPPRPIKTRSRSLLFDMFFLCHVWLTADWGPDVSSLYSPPLLLTNQEVTLSRANHQATYSEKKKKKAVTNTFSWKVSPWWTNCEQYCTSKQ